MRRPLFLLLMLAAACAACSSGPGSGSPGPSSAGKPSRIETMPAATQSDSASPAERMALPDGFPVLEGAVPEAMPAADLGLIALWSTDRVGSAVYDFYETALPSAGYPIIGLYPGGGVAQIRFAVPDGSVWQMVAYGGLSGRVTIEIRQDRP